MCGSLRRENMAALAGKDPQPEMLVAGWGKRGDQFAIAESNGSQQVAEFNGHARDDNLESWFICGWKPADLLHVIEYTEGHGKGERKYKVPQGNVIRCVTRQVSESKRVFNIITRDAEGAEKDTWPRFPTMGPRRY